MKTLLSILFLCIVSTVNAQNDTAKVFSLDLEFRPRMEFRRGFAKLPEAGDKPAFFISNRTRFNINYEQKRFKFHASIQDVRVWGQTGANFSGSQFGVFEAYIEPYFNDKWSIRIGRQALDLDNSRLFGEANWSQTGRAHEGINLRYFGKKINSQLIACYNQSSEQIFGTDYALATSNYLFLGVHIAKFQLSKSFSITTLNSVDAYQPQQLVSSDLAYARGTSGGRLTFQSKNWKATVAAFYQYGDLVSGTPINAYYLQPEIAFEHKKFKARLGMEYLSGDKLYAYNGQSNSFSLLYRSPFKHMGNMNYFRSFPNDTDNKGLVNPYLLLKYKFSDRFSVRSEWHGFFTQQDISLNIDSRRYLGIEQDLTFKYKVNDFISMSAAVCVLAPSENMSTIQSLSIYTTKLLPVYSYFMLTVKPELFRFSKLNDK
jgi:hypothetical protein